MTAALHPSSTLVMVEWLRQTLGVPAAATLPPPAGWASTGFLTVTPVGGTPGVYVPDRAPVMQVDCWGANLAAAGSDKVSRKVPLQQANELADKVVLATYTYQPAPVTLPAQFLPVWVESLIAVSEVRWVPEAASPLAHFSVDVQLRWAEQRPAVYN